MNTPTRTSTNPKNFDLNKNLKTIETILDSKGSILESNRKWQLDIIDLN